MTEPARTRLEGPGPAPLAPPSPGGAPSHPLLQLQRAAGNAAVAGLVQRAVVDRRAGTVNLTVGDEIALPLALKAKELAKSGVTDAELRALRGQALGDDTIGDSERMFLAALLDEGNAAKVASADVKAGTTFTFPRDTVEPHMARARDIDQATKDPAIAAERVKAGQAEHLGDRLAHASASVRAVFAQMSVLTGPAWQAKALSAVTFADGRVPAEEILEAMINAASDDTPGDRAMAAVVYAIAATAGHPMASRVRAGTIKVDQLAKVGGDFAAYAPVANQLGKGDTIKVPTALDPDDLGHRGVVIHELTHAAQDAAVAGGRVEMADREQAEIEAYRAGARYQLEQVAEAGLFGRPRAIVQVAALMNEPLIIALALECQADPQRFKPIVRQVNALLPVPTPEDQLEVAMRSHPAALTRLLQKAVQAHYHTQDHEHANELPLDQHRGESRFDWIDRT